MLLTDEKIDALIATGNAYRHYDGNGLYIQVSKTGKRYWRYKFRFDGVEKLYSLGKYPETSLAEARQKHSEAREKVAAGINPCQTRSVTKLALAVKNKTTFQQAASSLYHRRLQGNPEAKEPLSALMVRLEQDIFPYIGAHPVLRITPLELMTILLRKEQVSGSTSETEAVRHFCAEVIRAVIIQGDAHRESTSVSPAQKAKSDITGCVTLGQLELVDFFTALQGYQGTRLKLLAIRLLIMTGVTIDELRAAAWTEFDFDHDIWTIPAERSSTGIMQHVPLSILAQAIITELKGLTGLGPLLFPSRTAPQHPVSEASLEKVLAEIGYGNKISVRSFYHMMRKILVEQGATPTQIETQLLSERRQLLQAYADVLDFAGRGGATLLGQETFRF
ncbi:TPA: tyrosine-type recombinase/integrase [Serratia fonticola]|uniref:Prophage CPS-53 integrase n=1 Tax=Serratia fonticola TaxID=47917 RepID=A0A3S4WXY9_SERFO|nr:integrase arm-type DNA-binding domain-containing protein [Serratia fonticola]MBL5862852.1 integrase arm-type DNA-binding domain-containing protein [Serratia fonticola]CAI0699003.1 Putative prophage CPS-53 integrase [Serratia fonticola]VEI68106.1 Putative prophage CPS-53 integrase [Serratia fonticola]